MSDTHNVGRSDGFGERAYYGGTLIAESMAKIHIKRAAECVNFCAGVEFPEGGAYVGGLADVLDALQLLHERMVEPTTPCISTDDRSEFRLWSDINAVLKMFRRDEYSRSKAQEGAA